jgi:hypothetical protein
MRRDRIGKRRIDDARIAAGAARAIEESMRAGAAAYDRLRDLPRLARIDPGEAIDSLDVAERIVARLAAALRAERNRARSGHWTYDLNRHIALRQAYLAETERLATLRRISAPTDADGG